MGGSVMVDAVPSARSLKSLEDLRSAGIRVVRLSFSDLHGVCRSKDIPLEVFASTRGSEFAAAVFALDLASNALDTPGSPFGPTAGYPDTRVVARMETLTRLSWEKDTAGLPSAMSPRAARRTRTRRVPSSSGWSPATGIWEWRRSWDPKW